MGSAFWVAAAAVLTKEGSLPEEILDRWEECVHTNTDPEIVNKIFEAAFPVLERLPMDELAEVASALLAKSLSFTHDGAATGEQHIALLGPLSGSLAARPGLLLFAAETIKLWVNNSQASDSPPLTEHQKLLRATDVLLWFAKPATGSPTFGAFADILADGLLLRMLCECQNYPLASKLKIMMLVGLCCEASVTVLEVCWAALENVLCWERCDEVLHLTACALFESISCHAATMLLSTTQTRTAASIENGLSCPLTAIQFPAIVAAGKVLQKGRWVWQEDAIQRVRAAASQALRSQQEKLGAWGAWEPSGGGGANGSKVVANRKFTPQDCLAALRIINRAIHAAGTGPEA